MVNLPKKGTCLYICILLFKKKTTLHLSLTMNEKKYSNAFILQRMLNRMTQWVTGAQNALNGLRIMCLLSWLYNHIMTIIIILIISFFGGKIYI